MDRDHQVRQAYIFKAGRVYATFFDVYVAPQLLCRLFWYVKSIFHD